MRRLSCVLINRKEKYPQPQHNSNDIRYHIIHIKRPVWQEILHPLGRHRQSYPRHHRHPYRQPVNAYAYKKPGEEQDTVKKVVETDLHNVNIVQCMTVQTIQRHYCHQEDENYVTPEDFRRVFVKEFTKGADHYF